MSLPPLRPFVVAVAVVAITWMLPGSVLAASADAADGIDPDASCTSHRRVGERLYVQTFDTTDVTGQIAGIPDRLTTDFGPGESGRICVGFQNRTGGEVSLRFDARDFGVGRDGRPIPFGLGDADHGAGEWLELPPQETVSIQHGELVWLEILVEVPVDTTGGSAYAGIAASAVPAAGGRVESSQARVTPSVVVQVFFDVPGDVERDGELRDVRSGRLVWWDGLDLGRIPVLDRLRGREHLPVRFTWRNTGSVSENVSARLEVKSSLGGRTVADVKVPERIVLRDGERDFEAAWVDDIPLVGRFEPTLVVSRSDGSTIRRELPAVWVIPSWWYLLALAIAIALPLWWRRRSRQRYHELLDRLEAAEARAAGDEAWDDDPGAWSR